VGWNLESLLEIVCLEMMAESVRAGTQWENWRERILDFMRCGAENVCARTITCKLNNRFNLDICQDTLVQLESIYLGRIQTSM